MRRVAMRKEWLESFCTNLYECLNSKQSDDVKHAIKKINYMYGFLQSAYACGLIDAIQSQKLHAMVNSPFERPTSEITADVNAIFPEFYFCYEHNVLKFKKRTK